MALPDAGPRANRIFPLSLAVLGLWGLIFQLWALFCPALFSDSRNAFNLWWAVHLALAWQLASPRGSTWIFCAVISWLEIAIRASKIALFLINPEWRLLPGLWLAQHAAALLLFLFTIRYLYASKAGKALRDLR